VHGVGLKIGNKKDAFDLIFDVVRSIPAEINGGFLKIRRLTRLLTELIEDSLDGLSFFQGGLAT